MKTILVAVAFVALAASAASADRRHISRGKAFEANKVFGAGIELGAPTGLTGKYFMDTSHAIDFGIGDIDHYGDKNGLHLYGDYLWHPVSLASTEDFELPLYFGLGARIWDFDDNHDVGGFAIGARVPVGVAFDFNNVPLDVFIQATFVLDLLIGYAPENIYPALDVSIGVRYWFE
jgi:opacity protein-like surface antigen